MACCLYVRRLRSPRNEGSRLFFCIRRVPYADVTWNGTRIGDYEGFCSPFEFEVTDAVRFGRRNQLVLGVDNRPRPGRDTVGTANYFGNWGGIGGAVYLEARPAVHLADIFAIPRVAESRVVLRVEVAGDQGAPETAARSRGRTGGWERRRAAGSRRQAHPDRRY
jgi:hypothetical protein